MREPCCTARGVVEVGARRHAHAAARDAAGRAAGTGPRRRARAACPCRPRRGRRRRTARRSARRWRAPAPRARRAGWCARISLRERLRVFEHLDAGRLQQRQRLVEDAALRQGQRDHGAMPAMPDAHRPQSSGVVTQPLDVGADGAQLGFHPVVAAVEVVDALDQRLALGDEAGDHQAGRGAQVGRHHGRARQPRHAVHDRGVAVDLDAARPGAPAR